ncbi:hypothetical protein [Candidatus Mycobacterium methanotrophicum]|uniref:hypothetical protein n=1 Tax=Candidatus Mycobacterium methanotrophicum TaxID=2943498 RepID=UPI001C572D30|nr:hypothetical protein [Candidatus Mycobacterium methanotrophicum]
MSAPARAALSRWAASWGQNGSAAERPGLTDVAVPLRLRHGHRELAFFSMTAVVGAPLDVTVAEVAIESFYPADAETAAALHTIGK